MTWVRWVDRLVTSGIPWGICEELRQRQRDEWGTPDDETHADIHISTDDPGFDTLTIWWRADRVAPRCRNGQPCRSHA